MKEGTPQSNLRSHRKHREFSTNEHLRSYRYEQRSKRKPEKNSFTSTYKKSVENMYKTRYISADPEFMKRTNLFVQIKDDMSIIEKMKLKRINRRERRRHRARRLTLFRDPTYIL